MPSWPSVHRGSMLPGLVAVALFAVLMAVFLSADPGAPAGLPADVNVTGTIGYALIGIPGEAGIPTEGFLAALIIVGFALDAALEGSLLLATREDDGGED